MVQINQRVGDAKSNAYIRYIYICESMHIHIYIYPYTVYVGVYVMFICCSLFVARCVLRHRSGKRIYATNAPARVTCINPLRLCITSLSLYIYIYTYIYIHIFFFYIYIYIYIHI